jgi:sarcosine oxidase subunit beta
MHELDQRSLQEVAPYVSDRMRGGALCPSEGIANPLVAATAFANSAVHLGARVMTSCEVIGISRAGSVYTVHTRKGDFTAKRIVNAAGINAGRVAAFVGARFGIEAYPIQVSVTEPVVPLVRHLLYAATNPLTLKQMKVGTLVIGGGWASRIDRQGRAEVSIESLTRNLALALEVVPALRPVKVVRTWAAIVNGTSSWLPILGELPRESGFFMNCVPWTGFTGGPAGGRIVASLVQGQEAPVDFDISAFLPH